MRDLLDVYIVTGQIGTGKTTTAERLRTGLGISSIDRDSIREELGILLTTLKISRELMPLFGREWRKQ